MTQVAVMRIPGVAGRSVGVAEIQWQSAQAWVRSRCAAAWAKPAVAGPRSSANSATDAAGHVLLDVRAQRAEDGGERAGVEEEHRGAHQVRPSSSPEVRNTHGKYARSDCPFAASALM